MKKLTFLKSLLLVTIMLFSAGPLFSQVNISAGSIITQDFDVLGTSATATLPTGWKVDKNATVRTVGTYTAAGTATEQIAGNNMSSSATNGIYNYGAGDATTATDRAVGGISSGSASKSVNVYVQLTNNGSTSIENFTISFDVEKYRNGSNPAGFTIQMYYSTDGSTWTAAGSDFIVSFPADGNNNGFTPAPGATFSVTDKTLSQSLAVGTSLYLAWNYSVTSGTTTSNAQALGIDNVSITANASATHAPTITVTEVTIPTFSTNVGSSATNTIHVAGTNLTEDIVLEISGTNADQFSVYPTSLTPSEGTVAETDVTITYTPTSAGTHTATLTLSSTGATDVTRSLSGTAGLAAPVATEATSAGKTSFIANWEPVTGAEEYEISVYTKTQGTTTADDLFISEYVEGSSNNKALEIFNGTGADVDLSHYSLKKQTNGAGEYTNERTLSGTLFNGDVYVIANTLASDAIKAKADLTENTITAYSGNDAIGLFKNGTQIDEVGVFNQVSDWGKDVTLVRKSSVTLPKVPYDASEWDSYGIDYIDNLGTHTMDGFGTTLHPIAGSPFTVSGTETSKVITGLSPATTYYYTVVAISGSVRSAASNEIAASTLSVGVPSMTLRNIYVRDGKIYVNASAAGQRIEVYNTLGQRLVNVASKEGENEISVPAKGILLVKVGSQVTKVMVP